MGDAKAERNGNLVNRSCFVLLLLFYVETEYIQHTHTQRDREREKYIFVSHPLVVSLYNLSAMQVSHCHWPLVHSAHIHVLSELYIHHRMCLLQE